MSQPNAAIDRTVVYQEARAGRRSASIPAVPGTISTGRTKTEARRNVVGALRTMPDPDERVLVMAASTTDPLARRSCRY
jgi:hypothetical protein